MRKFTICIHRQMLLEIQIKEDELGGNITRMVEKRNVLWRGDPLLGNGSSNTFPWRQILGNNPSLCDKQTFHWTPTGSHEHNSWSVSVHLSLNWITQLRLLTVRHLAYCVLYVHTVTRHSYSLPSFINPAIYFGAEVRSSGHDSNWNLKTNTVAGRGHP